MDSKLPRSRFPFVVKRTGDAAVIAMDCGGVTRVRHMPCVLLKAVGDLCRFLQEEGERALKGECHVPEFPRYVRLVEGGIPGTCYATLGAHRLGGRIESVVSLYDEGDESAPVLILVEQEIDEFIAQTE